MDIVTQISSADLLQADVTIIAGILVLLTISMVGKSTNFFTFLGDPLAFIAFSPIFFVISAVFLLLGSLSTLNTNLPYTASVVSFIVGLGYLIIAMIVIAVTMAKNRNQLSSA